MSRSDVPLLDEDKQECRFLDSGYTALPRCAVSLHIISLVCSAKYKKILPVIVSPPFERNALLNLTSTLFTLLWSSR